jgi:hypothetical protein
MATRKSRERSRNFQTLGNQQKKKKRLKRKARANRARLKKRASEMQKLMESEEDIPMMEIICQTKRGFPDRLTALLCKPNSGLSIYQCDVCLGFHYTSQKRRNS